MHDSLGEGNFDSLAKYILVAMVAIGRLAIQVKFLQFRVLGKVEGEGVVFRFGSTCGSKVGTSARA